MIASQSIFNVTIGLSKYKASKLELPPDQPIESRITLCFDSSL